MIVNIVFLESYYISNKENDLQDMYTELEDIISGEQAVDNNTAAVLQGVVEKLNVSLMVQNQDGEILLATNNDKEWLQIQLWSYQFDQNKNRIGLRESTEDYEICIATDPRTDMEYMEMWGYFPTGESYILRTPMESIKDSATLANRFFLYVWVALIGIGVIIIWYVAKRITDPILELAKISTKMATLDFDAKYTSGGENEIGILGASFNEMSSKLENTISELKTANNQLIADIEQKEKLETMRAEFLSSASHELKTPIALIQGYAEGLKEGVGNDLDSQEFYCDVIIDEAGKMNQLVKNMLELSHLEYASDEIVYERFNIVEMISGILNSLEIIIQQKECKIIFDKSETCNVWGDQFKVEHVVRNYLTNALNHVADDNVIQVKIVVNDEQQKARISVFNTGKAIPEEDKARIWEKFYKVDKARTREYGGNGIGLSVVKAVMDSLHQDYGVENYDNGVSFWFELDMK